MSEETLIFTAEENAWSDLIDEVMTEAVAEAIAENKRLGLDEKNGNYRTGDPSSPRVNEDD